MLSVQRHFDGSVVRMDRALAMTPWIAEETVGVGVGAGLATSFVVPYWQRHSSQRRQRFCL